MFLVWERKLRLGNSFPQVASTSTICYHGNMPNKKKQAKVKRSFWMEVEQAAKVTRASKKSKISESEVIRNLTNTLPAR